MGIQPEALLNDTQQCTLYHGQYEDTYAIMFTTSLIEVPLSTNQYAKVVKVTVSRFA